MLNTELIERYINNDPNRAKELMEKIGIKYTTLTLIRRGCKPSRPVLLLLSRELGVSVDTLLPERRRAARG